jgi:hypothetical protein
MSVVIHKVIENFQSLFFSVAKDMNFSSISKIW